MNEIDKFEKRQAIEEKRKREGKDIVISKASLLIHHNIRLTPSLIFPAGGHHRERDRDDEHGQPSRAPQGCGPRQNLAARHPLGLRLGAVAAHAPRLVWRRERHSGVHKGRPGAGKRAPGDVPELALLPDLPEQRPDVAAEGVHGDRAGVCQVGIWVLGSGVWDWGLRLVVWDSSLRFAVCGVGVTVL